MWKVDGDRYPLMHFTTIYIYMTKCAGHLRIYWLIDGLVIKNGKTVHRKQTRIWKNKKQEKKNEVFIVKDC